ncbi:MAG: GNAT family N-acetyltransferase [Candidatus Aegiribacteria sp.]|nr:GNAT family N-acetyltransferase [Candidatus Aegiribacteria sp.]
MIHRKFDQNKDMEACHRIWREVAWIENKEHEKAMDIFLEGTRALVGELNGNVEALVVSTPGRVRYLEKDITLSAVCGVTTSYAGRKRGLAGKLTAELIALDVAEGALLAGLGIFDQGYYDKLGFGTGPYETFIGFDPASLNLNMNPPPPVRLTKDDWELVHRSRLKRMRVHGNTSLSREEITRAEMLWSKNGFGLGYMDGDNELLSHHFWCGFSEGEHGPYVINWMCYRNYCQFLELLGLIKNLGDQVHLVKLNEPSAIQIQDLLKTPLRNHRKTEKSKFEAVNRSSAYWQIRICNLEKCLERTVLHGDPVTFNLKLMDPIENYLEQDAPWHGISGSYIVTLGPRSYATQGHDRSLPLLEASVGAFSRMWIGARPPTGLCVTDDLAGPEELIRKLDRILQLPSPRIDWEY